jgi:hypothetical protein
VFKKIWKKIKEVFIWLFSRKVGEAINNGADYADVDKMVKEMAENEKNRK